MVTVSRPMGVFIAVSVVAIGIYAYLGAQPDDSGAKLAKTVARPPDKPTDYTEQDYLARFDPPSDKSNLRNVFTPLLKNDTTSEADTGPVGKDILKVPANLAGGDPNWIFTGFAVINGVKTALLEDQTTHHSEFVGEGAAWKTSRVLRIGSGSVVFDDLAGSQVAVLRYDPFLASKAAAKEAPDSGVKPVDPTPALQGAIGPGGPPGPGQPRIRRGGGPPGGTMVINGTTFSVSTGD